MDHAASSFERSFPWRTAALAAAAVALVELLALLVVAGVRLAPGLRHTAAAAAPKTAAPAAAPRGPPRRPEEDAHAGPRAAAAAASALPRLDPHPQRQRRHRRRRARGIPTCSPRGYRGTTAADAPNHDYARSIVLYAPGFAREGRRLGHDAGVRIVGPLDGMKPSQLRGSQLVVILGGS